MGPHSTSRARIIQMAGPARIETRAFLCAVAFFPYPPLGSSSGYRLQGQMGEGARRATGTNRRGEGAMQSGRASKSGAPSRLPGEMLIRTAKKKNRALPPSALFKQTTARPRLSSVHQTSVRCFEINLKSKLHFNAQVTLSRRIHQTR